MKKSNVNVSVVIPTYNSAQHLERAVISVIEQTYPIHEIIIVDDQSVDKTVELAKKTLSRFGVNFQVLENVCNSGAAITRQKGVREAHGSHIAFLDSDDEWKPNHIQSLVSLFEASPNISFAFSRYEVCIDAVPVYYSPVCEILNFKMALKRTVVATPAVMVPKSSLPGEWEPRRTGQDYWLWLTLLRQYGQAQSTLLCTARVHQRSDSLSSNKFQNIADVWQVQEIFGLSKISRMVNMVSYLARALIKVLSVKKGL